ncbi:protein phosphatase 2C domain-containing protein [Bacteroides thetaiotaomicron]|uniref:PP2C family serine/threonine-protein phosphatase n=1 Tax=Bacteroides thetaiotaomicron TaxID=818 RepID=UPI00232CDDAA|nr:protein phosphatase 2C domain-containing protein [Bacteroides thetaiotaomicron]MDC2009058.1 protein phosphatase 2C domain-containing protein [Bacteroides thetaiotaomicron]MDC2023224.1 protein phosphatase 2C domain-containing protein [Bacteroides thetaiotaomicron]MDC2025802.1 protein phosphatase 2C domain-containing protein [Bacteroides thetaiotaomicron]MDC2032312.1 protein phosphatase 2C domain-containing protein [Bacteroides thetaiotaomicron]MDC2063275.1 protein phosphatase 2C domain-conta
MRIYNKSVEGASHKDSGLPCQDYSISQSFDRGSIIVVSDGHGSKTYVRSQVGSKFACEIAVEETKHFVLNNYDVLKEKGVKLIAYTPDSGDAQDSLFMTFFTAIHSKWYDAIVQDSQINTFTDDEKSKLGNADIKKAYGCTLIVAVKTADFTFAYQIGDGRLFAIIPYIRRWEQPVPWDSRCEDNVTTSLCNINPVERFRYYLNSGDNQPFAIFICSDGIEDCYDGEHNAMFASEKMEVEYTEILSNFLQKENFDDLCAEFLLKGSSLGSKDDMSIAFIIDDIYNIQDKWIELNRLYRGAFLIKSEHDYYKKNIDENKGRLLTLDKNVEQLDLAIQALAPDIEANDKELNKLQWAKNEMENRPVVCDSFIELIGNLLDTIKVWCDQYRGNGTVSVTNKFHDTLKEKLECAIINIKVKIEEMQQQIPGRTSKLQADIIKIEAALTQLKTKRERYEADRQRHKNKKEEIEKENEKYELLKEEKKLAFDSYKLANTENSKHINEELKKCMGVQVMHSSGDVSDEVKDVGRSWNIAKSPDEHIQITVYDNNVQFVLTDSNGVNNHSISLESFKYLYTMIDELYSTYKCSFELIDQYVTIITTTNERDEMISIELDHDSANMIWGKCMELINKQ